MPRVTNTGDVSRETERASATTHTRVRGLDGLRAVGALAVVAFHAAYGIVPGGLYGVDLFLVLSGFLITTILVDKWQRTGGIGYGPFLKRRLYRLYPPVLFLVAAFLVAALLLSGRYGLPSFVDALKPAAVAALYLENFAFGYNVIDVDPVFLHLWSLGLEMGFYLVWPLLLLGVLGLTSGRGRAVAVATLVVVAALAQQLRVHLTPDGGPLTFEGRSLPIVLGCALALALPWVRRRWDGRAVGAVGWGCAAVVGVSFLAPSSVLPIAIGLPIAAFGGAGLILSIVLGQEGRLAGVLDGRLPVAIGVRSYSLYLWHAPILEAFTAENAPSWSTAQRAVVALLLVVVCTEVAYRLVELPALRGLGQRRSDRLVRK